MRVWWGGGPGVVGLLGRLEYLVRLMPVGALIIWESHGRREIREIDRHQILRVYQILLFGNVHFWLFSTKRIPRHTFP